MSYYLRAIYRNTDWDKTLFPAWLEEGQLPSRIVRDLRADDDALSLWEIDDDKSNLSTVVAAIASDRKTAKNDFDYALLEKKHLDELVFTPTTKASDTAYSEMNCFHRDVVNLSINKVVYFAYLLSKHGKFDRIGWKQIEAQLKDAARHKQLNLKKLKRELKAELGISDQEVAT